MKQLALPLALLLAMACGGSGSRVISVPGKGAITVQIDPNPIRATLVSGETYAFPFEVIVRETGGRPVNVSRVSANVTAFGGISVGRESWDEARIRSMGYSTSIGANGELRYRFAPRKAVPDDRLFGGVSAVLTVEATDDTGNPATASTTVTVTR